MVIDGENGLSRTVLHDKREDFKFPTHCPSPMTFTVRVLLSPLQLGTNSIFIGSVAFKRDSGHHAPCLDESQMDWFNISRTSSSLGDPTLARAGGEGVRVATMFS